MGALYKYFFSFQTQNSGLHRRRTGWNNATEHKGAGSHSHCRSCMGGQRDLRAAVIVYIHCVRAADQSAMRVASSVHVSVPEMLNIALNERRKRKKQLFIKRKGLQVDIGIKILFRNKFFIRCDDALQWKKKNYWYCCS